MGRLQVRTAIQSAVQGAGIDYVGTVFPARPIFAGEEAYTQNMNGQAIAESVNGSACVVVVNITDDSRNRYGDVGRGNVADWWKHQVALELFFACIGNRSYTAAEQGVAAQQDYDSIVDALTVFIRGNPTMSAPSTVWSAGEYTFGVKHTQSMPYTSEDGLTVLINGIVRFEAWEQPVGAAGSV